MTRAMALEFGPGGVRVNAVCPGMIEHERTRQQRGEDKPYDHQQRILAYPLRRLGEPEDVSNVVDGGISIQLAEALMYPPFRALWNEAVPDGTPM